MYAPGSEQGGNYNEWVEIYNSGNSTIDLTSWTIDGKDFDNVNITPGEYLVIAEKLIGEGSFESYYGNDDGVWNEIDANFSAVDSKLISLDDTQGEVILSNGTVNIIIPYNREMGADGNNKTLEKNKDGEWKESIADGGTPGEQNSNYYFSYDYSVLEITEVMADPSGNDDAVKPLGEWVEIYNSGNGPVHLEGLALYDEYDDHKLPITEANILNGLELCGGCYTVIYRDGDKDFELSGTTEDKVRLFVGSSKGFLIDSFSFTGSMEGMSWSKFDEEWYLTKPTPGKENVYTAGCDWSLDLETANSIFQGSDLDFNVVVSRNFGWSQNVTVKGKIEDIFGELVKEYSPWTNKEVTTTNSKSYSPNLQEGIYQISFWIESLVCNDLEESNNKIVKLIAINPQYKETDSSLEIEKLYLGNDKEAEWADQFTAKVNIYKGDESKYSVRLWAEMGDEKVSKTTKVNVYDEYKHYPLTLPLQLEPNCHNKIDDGKATLVVEAFGLRAEQGFNIKGIDEDVCKDYLDYVNELEKEKDKSQKQNSYQIIEMPLSVTSGEVFKVKVQLLNDDKAHDYQAWSYAYRGRKCYSCLESTVERNDNTKKVALNPGEAKIVEFLLKIDENIEEGEYKLKVKINKDGQKTNKELTEAFYVEEALKKMEEEKAFVLLLDGAEEESAFSSLSAEKEKVVNSLTGMVIYESSSEKAKKAIPYLLIVILGLLCFILIKRR